MTASRRLGHNRTPTNALYRSIRLKLVARWVSPQCFSKPVSSFKATNTIQYLNDEVSAKALFLISQICSFKDAKLGRVVVAAVAAAEAAAAAAAAAVVATTEVGPVAENACPWSRACA